MPIYEFEIQLMIRVKEEAADADEARGHVMDKLEAGCYTLELSYNAYVSDGREIKGV